MKSLRPSDRTWKWLISAFICLNLFTIVYVNLPERVHKTVDQAITARLFPQEQFLVRSQIYHLYQYAHLVGLDNRWQMFGRQSRFNWHYRIYGLYSDGRTTQTRLLPDPRQRPRNVFQRTLIDFKEGKFHLNIYGDKAGRMAYAYYLARCNPRYEGLPIQSVVYELQHQWIREPKVAQSLGSHLDPTVNKQTLDVFFVGANQPRINGVPAANP